MARNIPRRSNSGRHYRSLITDLFVLEGFPLSVPLSDRFFIRLLFRRHIAFPFGSSNNRRASQGFGTMGGAFSILFDAPDVPARFVHRLAKLLHSFQQKSFCRRDDSPCRLYHCACHVPSAFPLHLQHTGEAGSVTCRSITQRRLHIGHVRRRRSWLGIARAMDRLIHITNREVDHTYDGYAGAAA